MEVYDEEQQLEALKRWWRANGVATLIGVIAGIAVIIGWQLWQNYQQQKIHAASQGYQQLLDIMAQQDWPNALTQANQVLEIAQGTPYFAFTQLNKALIEHQQGHTDAAQAILKDATAADDQTIAHIARIRQAQLLLNKGDYEAGLALLEGVNLDQAPGFAGWYQELKGDFYLALQRPGEARNAYQAAQLAGISSPLLPMKLADLAVVDTGIE
ncbi:MAG: tetratricopeptide repeat protein [Methylococcales bacterium]|nr:tetratricopeptide repeat protein [Methylococcales bacterium]